MSARHVVALACFLFPLLPGIARADDKAAARTIVDRAIEFAGGREALARYQQPFVRTAEGTALGGKGQEPFKIKVTTLLPDKQRTDQTLKNGGTFQLVFDGQKGWNKTSGGPVARQGFGAAAQKPKTEMIEAAVRATRDRLYALWLTTLLPLDDDAFRLSLVPEIMVENRPAVGINVSHDDRPDVQLYFDKDTFAPVKVARKFNDRLFEEFYDDYAELDGLVYAKKTVQYGNGQKTVEMQTTDLKFLDEVEDGTFAEP